MKLLIFRNEKFDFNEVIGVNASSLPPYALKGQKLQAQGNALGLNVKQ